MQKEFENIIRGCMAAERDSQYKLYNLLAPKLRVVCRRYMKSKEEAEDCLQESFIKIFANIDKYRGEGNFAGWARRITVNTLITKLNKNKMVLQSIDNENDNLQLPSGIDPSAGLNHEDLLKIIDQLPEDKKVVFNLYAIEGYDHKEIGEMLGISDSHSRSILFRARQVLLSALQKMKTGHEQRLA